MERAALMTVLRATGCAEERGGWVFLRGDDWSAAEQAAYETLAPRRDAPAAEVRDGWLCVRTGGSGGGLKFARHDERTLGAAVAGWRARFGRERFNVVDVLPPFHVSGLMARMRCAAAGGTHRSWRWKQLEAGDFPALDGPGDWVISLVPTQLQRLLAHGAGADWLRRFRLIFIGGGPVWPELAAAASAARLPISLSYGMTETAAMVAAGAPADFLAGDRSAGPALPHARITLSDEGLIQVEGEEVFRGYFPDTSAARTFSTQDAGQIDSRGHLHVLGRRDAVIITGGKKVQPADVEAALRASGEFDDVAVIGVPDREWGEIVVACYAARRPPDLARAVRGLAAHQQPKRFVPLTPWPRTAQGKINRAELLKRVT